MTEGSVGCKQRPWSLYQLTLPSHSTTTVTPQTASHLTHSTLPSPKPYPTLCQYIPLPWAYLLTLLTCAVVNPSDIQYFSYTTILLPPTYFIAVLNHDKTNC